MSERSWFRALPLSGIALVLGLLFFSLAFQGVRGLWEPDEGRYTIVPLEMLESGDWLVPRMHYETPHWTKPPLTYWSVAVSLKLFGRNEFAARLTSAMAFFATALLLGMLGQIFLQRMPYMAVVVYATSVLPFIASNLITTDSLLALWECLAIYAFARVTWHPQCHNKLGWLMVMWAAFGLAFLTKGPPGMLPLLAIVAFLFLTPGQRSHRSLMVWPGILVWLAVALPWYLLVIWKNPGLLTYFIHDEVIARVATDNFGRNSEWYGALLVYLPTLLFGTLPWTYWLLAGAKRGLLNWRLKGWSVLRDADEKQRFLLLWLFLPLLIFFLSRSRLPLYLLPLAVPMALLVCRELQRWPTFPQRKSKILITVWVCVLLLLRGTIGLVDTQKDARAVSELMRKAGIEQCEEIVFYGGRPMRGLRFYLGCSIELIKFGEMADELKVPEDRLWVVRKVFIDQFKTEMTNTDQAFELVADLPGLWQVYREASDKK